MSRLIGKKVIVRSVQAGVFYGTLEEKNGDEVMLTNARKLHYWDGAGAVEGLAKYGVTKPKNCRFTVWNEESLINNWCQILPTSEAAQKSIEGVKEWKL